MWFKQVQLYELSSPLAYDPELLAEKLQNFPLTPCLPSLPLSLGWVSPLEKEGSPLVFAADGFILINLAIAEKVLPGAVVRQVLSEKVKEVESRDHRKVGQKQKLSLKDEVIAQLLPQAFVKIQTIYACIDTRRQHLWLGSTSARHSEHFLLAWQKVLPEIGFVKPEFKKVGSMLTHWLMHASNPRQFAIEKNVVLQDIRQQTRIIRCQQQDLGAPSIQSLLKDGCEVKQLALTWQERIQFTLDDELQLRSMRFSDKAIDGTDDGLSDSPEIRLASDFTLLTANLTELFEDLLVCFTKETSLQPTESTLAQELVTH